MSSRNRCRLIPALLCLALSCAAGAETKRVNAKTLGELQIPIIFSAPAETVSLHQTTISSEIEARVIDVQARTADEVTADTMLVKLDCRDYDLHLRRAEAELSAADAQLKLAHQRLQRTMPLIDRKHVSQDVLDQRQAELDAAQANVESRQVQVDQARTDQSRCVIKSPFRAAVIRLHIGSGEFVRVGTPLLDIEDLNRVEVSSQVVPSDVPSLRQATELYLDFSEERYALKVNRISPVIDNTTRTQEVRLGFTAQSAAVGASGRLTWTEQHPGIPSYLLVQRDGGLGVFVVQNDRAEFLPLPHAVEGRPAVIKSPADTLIVTDGRHNLQSGDGVLLQD